MTSEALIKSYRNSLASMKSSSAMQNSLLSTQGLKRMTIQGHSDVAKMLTGGKQESRKTEAVHKRQSSDELAREESEAVDLNSVDITKSYTSPKKLEKALAPVKPSAAVPDNLFEVSKAAVTQEDDISGEYVKEFQVYNLNYDFDSKTFIDLATIPPQYLDTPTERDIYKFCKKILVYSKMEKEIPIIALIYIEKLMLKTRLLMNELNWRRFTFIALVIGSKV